MLVVTGVAIVQLNSRRSEADAFIVKGISGKDVLIDRTWDRGCVSSGKGSWMQSRRTLTGLELATTQIEYQNDSATPNCSQGRSMITAFTQALTNDQVRVPTMWVDEAEKAAAPPAGLEGVTEANGASGVLTFATRTPETQAQADQLNQEEFCGFTDWAPGVTKDLVPCFGVDPAKGTIVVDDRASEWLIYDGIGGDPADYPTGMPNFGPHRGPLDS